LYQVFANSQLECEDAPDDQTGDDSNPDVSDDDEDESDSDFGDEPDDVKATIRFKTRNKWWAGSRDKFSISFDDEHEHIFSLDQHSRGKLNTIELYLPAETDISKATIRAKGTDGWYVKWMSINEMIYDGVRDGVKHNFPKWLDNPCKGGYGEDGCATEFNVKAVGDCHTGRRTSEFSKVASFKFTTVDTRWARSNAKFYVKFKDDCAWYRLNNFGVNDFERNKPTLITLGQIHESADLTQFTLKIKGTDGWAVNTVSVNDMSYPLSTATPKVGQPLGDSAKHGVWLDACYGRAGYGHNPRRPCTEELTLRAE